MDNALIILFLKLFYYCKFLNMRGIFVDSIFTFNFSHSILVQFYNRCITLSIINMFDRHCLYYIRPNRDCSPTARHSLISGVSHCLIRMLNTSIYVVCLLVSSAWGTTITIEMNTLEVSNTLPRHIRRTWLWMCGTFQLWAPSLVSDRYNCICQTLVKVHYRPLVYLEMDTYISRKYDINLSLII